MHIVVQFPIIDYRPLLPNNGDRLANPDWPRPMLNAKPFIRGFGAVKHRNKGGNDDFPGEDYYCNAHLGMRYNDLHKQGISITGDKRAAIYNAYRRFYSDGYFVGKIEAGFVDNTEDRLRRFGLTETGLNLKDILEHYARLPVAIDGNSGPLYKAGPLLANSYYIRSTKKGKTGDWKKAIASGELVMMAVFPADSGIHLPANAFLLETFPLADGNSAKLHGYKLRTDEYVIKSWLLEIPLASDGQLQDARLLRDLRIYILRIHLEKETMRLLLMAIRKGVIQIREDSMEARLADAYFKKAGEKLFRKQRYDLTVNNLIDYALHSEDAADPGSFSTLQEGIYYFHDKYTREHIEQALTVMKPKKVLFICANPKPKTPLDFGKEYRAIIDALQPSIDQGNFQRDIIPSVKRDEFLDVLKHESPDYLHLSMHSSLTQGLYFEDSTGGLAPMPVQEFATKIGAFSKEHSLVAVILSACNSKAHAEAIHDFCQKAMGTKEAFPEDAGVCYAGGFYKLLFIGGDIKDCHEAGLSAIRRHNPAFQPVNNTPVDEIPQLF